MSFLDAREIPVDAASAERLQKIGLTYRLIDANNHADADAFIRADVRGFLGAEPTDDVLEFDRVTMSDRRNIGVFEQGAFTGSMPVATVNSWVTPLTIPGGELSMWAISAVTVAGTHRRRGIARVMLEGELRAAADAGVPIAGLTVSEATLYGRYGFGMALPMQRFRVDTRRAGWAGGEPEGRIEYIDRQRLSADLGAMHEDVRVQRAGDVAGWHGRWERMAGLAPGDTNGTKVRGVRYVDAAGAVRGIMAFQLTEIGHTFRHELSIRHLATQTSEALRALWKFALQHDLVDVVTASLRPLDDPLPILVADQRGVEQIVHDHGWLRILDVATVLGARTYSADINLTIAVADPLNMVTGTWRLRADTGGQGQVEAAEGASADITIGVRDLSALYAGGVRASQLAAAGLLDAAEEHVTALDRAFFTSPAPALSIWY